MRMNLSYIDTETYELFRHLIFNLNTNTNKAIPLQAWTDREGSKRLRLPDFKAIHT